MMAIVNLIAIDPRDDSRVLQYRVPENSREIALLQELFDANNIEHAVLAPRPKPRKPEGPPK